MNVRDLFLTIDQGGQSNRVFLFDRKGEIIASASGKVKTYRLPHNIVEHNPEEVVESIKNIIEKLFNIVGKKSENIAAAGLTTQRSNIICWDNKTGKALSPIISWQDRRAVSWINKFSHKESMIHKTTGLFPNAHYGVSKLRWCLDHLPEVIKAHKNKSLAWGPMASFLIFKLTKQQRLLTDPANGSRTLLLNLQSLDWDKEMLKLFDLPEKPLPRCVPTQFDFGDIGLGGGCPIPLRLVTGDQSAALFGNGLLEPETAYINIGTGAFVQRLINNFTGSSSKLLASIVLKDKNESNYVLEGTINGAGSALSQIEGELRIDPAERLQHLPEWMESEKSPPLFLNGVSGLGSPFWAHDFESKFIGEGDGYAKIVAVVESIIFLIQVNLEEMKKILQAPKKITISGGLASLEGLCQRIANISNTPVYRPVECEATSRGAAYILAGRPKVWPEKKIGLWFKPKPDSKLNKRFEQWLEYMKEAIANKQKFKV